MKAYLCILNKIRRIVTEPYAIWLSTWHPIGRKKGYFWPKIVILAYFIQCSQEAILKQKLLVDNVGKLNHAQ